MKRKRCLLLVAIFAILTAEILCSEPSTPRITVVRAGIGVMDARADPVSLESLGSEFLDLHLAATVMFSTDFLSTRYLSLAFDGEAWMTFGSYQGSDLLLGARIALFPSGPVRLYGTGGAGLGISVFSWTEQTDWPFFPVYETREEIHGSFAYAVGGGIEFGKGRRFFSIDYRYLAASGDDRLGGHLLCMSLGFLWR